MKKDSFLGRGWAFPPQFTKEPCAPVMVADWEDIQQSLHILLQTRVRERIMQSGYGCNLDVMLFESMSTTFMSFIRNHIESAIRVYEPRVNLLQVVIDPRQHFDDNQRGMVVIRVDYEVRGTNRRDNVVYPYYFNEGTNVGEASFPTSLK
jgi:uncharacterized protein